MHKCEFGACYDFGKRKYAKALKKWCCVCCISRVCYDPNGFLLLQEDFVDVVLRGAGVDVCAIKEVRVKEASV